MDIAPPLSLARATFKDEGSQSSAANEEVYQTQRWSGSRSDGTASVIAATACLQPCFGVRLHQGIPLMKHLLTTDFRNAPYWWDAAPLTESAGGALAPSYDVVIVGSGYTGLPQP
jgi:hypothetical protein